MELSRRQFINLTASVGAAAGMSQLLPGSSRAASSFRAMVGIFLFGGSDNWNMVVPTDTRYAAYATGRGTTLALPSSSLSALSGVPFGLHPSFAPLATAWDEGALNVMLNVGTLQQPLDKSTYQSYPTARPLNLMSHQDEQNQWQGLRMRDVNNDGFMGRQNDREMPLAIPNLLSLGGSTLALIGATSSPLILPSTGTLVRNGYNAAATDAVTQSRQTAIGVFSKEAPPLGIDTGFTEVAIDGAYNQAVTANSILTSATSTTDQYFKNTTTGVPLVSDIAHQLMRVARSIEARVALGHSRQIFFTSQGGFDTHSAQVNPAATTTGTQANLFNDLAQALAGFYTAMKALGLQDNVTAFTMSDFGRTFRVNAQTGTDHAWGNNHLILGGAVRDRTIHGAYPNVTLGGVQDIDNAQLGRWIPTTAIEEYIGPIAQWYGVAPADMPYVFPNWATWTTNGRGPIPLFA